MRRTGILTNLLLFAALLMLEIAHCKKSKHYEPFVSEEQGPDSVDVVDDGGEPAAEQGILARVTPKQTADPCDLTYCGHGRECQSAGGRAECVCQRHCKRHRKPVCGSDGLLYPNHCVLHRTACVAKLRIAVDHSHSCVKASETKMSDTSSASNQITPPHSTYLKGEPVESSHEVTFRPTAQCTDREYELLKEKLLVFNENQLIESANRRLNGTTTSGAHDYLVSLMFSHYDQNNDAILEGDELAMMSDRDRIGHISIVCSLADILNNEDENRDGHLDVNEFYLAFAKLYSVSVVSLDKALEVNHVTARVGDNVEIKCDVTGTPLPPIIWRRNEIDLSTTVNDEIKVFVDGSLYLTRVQLIHAGNYTCHAQRNRDVVQTHILHVETMPQVRVVPHLQSRRPSEEATMQCHASGVPTPRVQWLKNDENLRSDSRKYEVVGNGTFLEVHRLTYSDTGAYMCVASNNAGSVTDISSLVIQDETISNHQREEKRFFVFHDKGVGIYEPVACRLFHHIQGTDIIPGTQEYVCGEKGVNCSWGRAINVADRYIFVSQPTKNRVLVISKIQMVVVDLVMTDNYPVDLHYVSHLDQVWLLCRRYMAGEQPSGIKTIQVIRDAGQKKKHHIVHPQPLNGQFDLVSNLFVPSAQETGHKFRHGYVTHTNQRGMYKIDLVEMKYIRTIDLTQYNCVPKHIQFTSIGGIIIIECVEPITTRASGQLLMDYLTDSVLAHRPSLLGKPHVSPDSRFIVTVDRRPTSVTIVTQEATEEGLKFVFDIKTTLNISDIAFFPSQTSHSYDVFASATDKEDILFLNLSDGKVEMITGVGVAMHSSLSAWDNPNRPIVSSGVFGHYLITPSDTAVFVVNGETRTVNCEIGNLFQSRLAVWVTSMTNAAT